MSMASAWPIAAPISWPISSLQYGKCHWSGASTTPSSETNSDTITLLTSDLLFDAVHGDALRRGRRTPRLSRAGTSPPASERSSCHRLRQRGVQERRNHRQQPFGAVHHTAARWDEVGGAREHHESGL